MIMPGMFEGGLNKIQLFPLFKMKEADAVRNMRVGRSLAQRKMSMKTTANATIMALTSAK